jgi:predicted nucleic acid-binding protein
MNAMKTETAFWDTSALVPVCCAQAGPTTRARALLRQFPKPVIWWGTQVEIHSALVRLRQEEAMTERELNASIKRWEQLELIAREVNPGARVRQLAKELPAQYQLRTLDAFQLAAAMVWCQERPRRRPCISFDDRLAFAAEKVGFTVYPQ